MSQEPGRGALWMVERVLCFAVCCWIKRGSLGILFFAVGSGQ